MNKWKILTPILVVALLAFAFWYGGDAPEMRGWTVGETDVQQESVEENVAVDVAEDLEDSQEPLEEVSTSEPDSDTELEVEIAPEPAPETTQELEIPAEVQSEAPVEADNPSLEDSGEIEITATSLTVTLSVRCDTILDNMDWLTAGKESLVPADGVIFPATEVTFYEGESVFNVLLREMKVAGIHMEYENTPLYSSAYIEGIGNLYEYDCGQLSGWLFSVNGWFPNYGCSRYLLQDGDVVEWVYSCDLGEDVGGGASAGGQYEG